MKKIQRAVAIAILVAVSACWSTVKKDAGTVAADADQCIKAERSAASLGSSVISIALDIAKVVAEIAAGADPKAAVAGLVVKYGEPIVACTVIKLETGASAGSGSATPSTAFHSPTLASTASKLISDNDWGKYRGGGGAAK